MNFRDLIKEKDLSNRKDLIPLLESFYNAGRNDYKEYCLEEAKSSHTKRMVLSAIITSDFDKLDRDEMRAFVIGKGGTR